jgi:hypothetical protein
LTTSVFGMHALEQVRGGDVGEVERRVLAQQDHVERVSSVRRASPSVK